MEFVISPTPDPSSFLRDLFNPQNELLFAIYQRVTNLAISDRTIEFWRNELINSSRRDLYTSDGFLYALQQLNLAVTFTANEITLLNEILAKYYLPTIQE